MPDLTIANTVTDLIQGDVQEHFAFSRIPLQGDVLGLGTTSSLDNGELTFLPSPDGQRTTIWKCEAFNGGLRAVRDGDGSSNFPYVCFTRDASSLQRPVDLSALTCSKDAPLQALVADAIRVGRQSGALEDAAIYGVRALTTWDELVITVASKLCMGQQRRNSAWASSESGDGLASTSIYDLLQHYRLAPEDPGNPSDPVRFLGRSLHWDCCGFFDCEPELGRVTVPQAGAFLHIHGCSTDLRHGGHLHHEHPSSHLRTLERLVLYPLTSISLLSSDLCVRGLEVEGQTLQFSVCNEGELDVSDIGVAVVVDDRYSDHRFLRIPWMEAGGEERFSMTLGLDAGEHDLAVIVDPQQQVIEPQSTRANNRVDRRIKV